MSNYPSDLSNDYTDRFADTIFQEWRITGTGWRSGRAKVTLPDKEFKGGRFTFVEVAGAGHMVRYAFE